MKKAILILVALVLLIASWAAQAFQCSTVNPYPNQQVVSVCHTAYQTFVSKEYKLPMMVHYEIDPAHEQYCTLRNGSFKADPLLDKHYQATKADYAKNGYDIGHMFPAEDALYELTVEHETFYYSNAVPQAPSFNRGKWKTLETMIRDWSIERNVKLDVYSGPIFSRIIDGTGSLPVPAEFYKIVVDESTNEAIVFRMKAPRADLPGWHGTITSMDIVTDLKEVPIDLKQWKLQTKLWSKPKHTQKICN